MNLIRRFTTSISASLESAVGQLENHDAIVEASIRQTQQSVAKTKARINTLRQQHHCYEKQLNEAQTQFELWTGRATKLADSDEKKALQCMTRRRQYQHEISRLTTLIDQQTTLIHDVSANLDKLQLKLDEMKQKHNLMRSRQAVADVNRAVGQAERRVDVNDTFERWESTILEHEMAISDSCTRDPLDAEFIREESQTELLEELNALKTSKREE